MLSFVELVVLEHSSLRECCVLCLVTKTENEDLKMKSCNEVELRLSLHKNAVSVNGYFSVHLHSVYTKPK